MNDPDLAEFDRFLLPPGARFGDRRQWWDGRLRPRPHEGVDLVWYREHGGQVARLSPFTRIPAPAAGRVVRVIEDFLGYSVFLAHEGPDADRILVSIYGHVEKPALELGKEISGGDLLVCIARPRSGRVPPHLHLSTVQLPTAFPFARLDWSFLQAFPEAGFCDPLSFLACPWEQVSGLP